MFNNAWFKKTTKKSILNKLGGHNVGCFSGRAIRHLDGKEYRGRPLVVEESRARPPNSTKVFVGNLSSTCTADDLHGLFQSFGRVLDCDKVKGQVIFHVSSKHRMLFLSKELLGSLQLVKVFAMVMSCAD